MAFKMKQSSPYKGFFGDLKEAVKTVPKAAKELGGQWKKMLTRKKK
jgi:hypothetical protein|tara:strand:- start:2616 stop:2753 length:138 start_codon:yes stop_codon:yes gene_type:complete